MTDVRDMARSEGRTARDLLRTIASTSSDPDFFRGLAWLPNPDRVLVKLGSRESVLDDVLTDSHVFADVAQRKAATTGLAWAVTESSSKRQDRKAAELCREVLEDIDLEHVVATLLDAPLWGRAYVEVMWAHDSGRLLPRSVVDRPRRRFTYTPEGELRLLTKESPLEGVPVPARKILAARQWPTQDNPYGAAALSRCFWPWTFKHHGQKFWVILAEKFGIPWVIARVARGMSDGEVAKILQMLKQLQQDAVGTVPEGTAVEIHEAQAQSKGGMHAALIAAMNAEISKALLGQTLTTEVGEKGSYAASKTHAEVRGDIAAGDQRLVASVLGELCAWVTELNVAGARPPKFTFLEEEDRAEWLKLFEGGKNIGLPMSRKFVHDKLQIPPPEDDEDVLEAEGGHTGGGGDVPFAETSGSQPGPVDTGRPRRADFAAEDEPPEGLRQLEERAIGEAATSLRGVQQAMRAAAGRASDLEELRGALTELVTELPLEQLAAGIARALFVAELAGRAEARDEAEHDFAEDDTVFEPLPFREAIDAFREKVPLSPPQFRDLVHIAKARAFSVAGVMGMDAVVDMQEAVDQALAEGSNLADFRKRMEKIASERGEMPLGRHHIETVFRTNVLTAYDAGRYRQLTDPDLVKLRPYWQYRSADDGRVRPAHRALHDKVFRADDPAWAAIYPPNGFNCRCQVVSLSKRDVERRSLTVENGDDVVGKTVQVGATAVNVRPDTGWNHNPAVQTWIPDLSLYPEAMVAEFERRRKAWSGARSDAPDIDPEVLRDEMLRWRQERFASDADVEAVAGHFDLDPAEVRRVKEYLFPEWNLDIVNIEMWDLARAGDGHESVRNFLDHELRESALVQEAGASFDDPAAVMHVRVEKEGHQRVLDELGHREPDLFSPTVIEKLPEYFSDVYRARWGLPPRKGSSR